MQETARSPNDREQHRNCCSDDRRLAEGCLFVRALPFIAYLCAGDGTTVITDPSSRRLRIPASKAQGTPRLLGRRQRSLLERRSAPRADEHARYRRGLRLRRRSAQRRAPDS